MGYVLLMGFKLCICTADGWDLDHACKTLDFNTHLDVLIGKLELVLQLRHQSGKRPAVVPESVTYRLDNFSRFLRQTR
jgi:hypothetical protein